VTRTNFPDNTYCIQPNSPVFWGVRFWGFRWDIPVLYGYYNMAI
jgi:hypothetical protein